MKVIVTPNKKMPIRGLLAHPFTDEKELDLTEMQIKRVLGYGAKVNVVSLDGIKAEITLVNGELNTDAIKATLEAAGEVDHPVESKTAEVVQAPVETEEPETPAEPENNAPANQPQQHMTKAQRKAARRAEAQQRAAEEAAKKEAEAESENTEEPEAPVETADEVPESTIEETPDVDEDAAKDNAEVIETGEAE